jgi:hypothetical protein
MVVVTAIGHGLPVTGEEKAARATTATADRAAALRGDAGARITAPAEARDSSRAVRRGMAYSVVFSGQETAKRATDAVAVAPQTRTGTFSGRRVADRGDAAADSTLIVLPRIPRS